MAEKLASNTTEVKPEQLEQAKAFLDTHVYTTKDPEQYYADTTREWFRTYPGHHRPMWLRRTFDMGAEFGAAVDYCVVVMDAGYRTFATMVLDGSDVEVWLPKGRRR